MRLQQAGLIVLTQDDGKISILDSLAKIQAALGVSLREIAGRADGDNLVVKPIFGRPSGHGYGKPYIHQVSCLPIVRGEIRMFSTR
jgi:hypothetical protein